MPIHPFLPADIEAALGQRYVVGPEIAIGGQGAVFQATRISHPDGTPAHDVVALKLHLYRNQDIRVRREIEAMQTLSHPNLARLIEHGTCDVAGRQTRYIAWELIQGQTLSQRLRGGHMLEFEVLPLARDVASAISTIWSRRIVHGDIKPSNIMLRESGGAVLIDLGAAKFLEKDYGPRPFRRLGDPPDDEEAPRTMGTLGYFSPEQIRQERSLSCASDIFSLGVVMLQCLLGYHPTNYDQSALADGLRVSTGILTVSDGMLSALARMLSARPSFRPTPAGLSGYFQNLLENIEAELAMGARGYQSIAQGWVHPETSFGRAVTTGNA